MRKRKFINKQVKKKIEGKCYFCGEDDYNCLHNHRIIAGKDGGLYTDKNTIVICANCHSKIHGKNPQIVIDGQYPSTSAKWFLRYWENGEEKWK